MLTVDDWSWSHKHRSRLLCLRPVAVELAHPLDIAKTLLCAFPCDTSMHSFLFPASECAVSPVSTGRVDSKAGYTCWRQGFHGMLQATFEDCVGVAVVETLIEQMLCNNMAVLPIEPCVGRGFNSEIVAAPLQSEDITANPLSYNRDASLQEACATGAT